MRINIRHNVAVSTEPFHGVHLLAEKRKLLLVGHHHTFQTGRGGAVEQRLDLARVHVGKPTQREIQRYGDPVRADSEARAWRKSIWRRLGHGGKAEMCSKQKGG